MIGQPESNLSLEISSPDYLNTTETQIHIVMSVWDLADTYNQNIGVTLVSLLSNCKERENIVIHLLYDELKNSCEDNWYENKKKYQQISRDYNVTIHYHHISPPDWLHQLPSVRFFSFGTFLRLFIPDTLENISKVIYLDGDIVVTTDISGLWKFDMDSYSLGVKKPLINDNSGFNAGVLLMNLDKIRREYDLAKMSLDYLNKHPTSPYLDQDCLNQIFKNDLTYFPSKYNANPSDSNEFIDLNPDDCCIHFAWTKPWKIYRDNQLDLYYWKYFIKTPWCDSAETVIKLMANCSYLLPSHARLDAERLIVFPLSYRLNYWWVFTFSLVKVHFNELIWKIRKICSCMGG